MAKGQAVELPTTFKVQAAKQEFPKREGRPPGEAYLALLGILDEAEMNDPLFIPQKDEAKRDAIERHLRRAASELEVGLKTLKLTDGIQFQKQTKRQSHKNNNGESEEAAS
jgi:hypothetical protein